MKEFNVLQWEFNDKKPSYYDVLPYFRQEYKSCKKKDRPVTKEQWIEFVRRKGKYRYWARCEYEVIVSQWPPTDKSYKLDAWEQIEANLNLVVQILMEEQNVSS